MDDDSRAPLQSEAPVQAAAAPRFEPDTIRLSDIQASLIDQLVVRKQERTGFQAARARREVVTEVLADGILARQQAEGIAS